MKSLLRIIFMTVIGSIVDLFVEKIFIFLMIQQFDKLNSVSGKV